MIQGVIQILLKSTAVKSAVGLNKASDRYKVFPVFADAQELPPFSVALITGNSPNYCKDVASRLDEVSFRITTYSERYEELDKLDNAIRFALDGFRGDSENINMDVWLVNQQDAGVEGKEYFARISDFKAHVTRKP